MNSYNFSPTWIYAGERIIERKRIYTWECHGWGQAEHLGSKLITIRWSLYDLTTYSSKLFAVASIAFTSTTSGLAFESPMSLLGVCMVRLVQFFPKFITEPIKIDFLIIVTNAPYQGLKGTINFASLFFYSAYFYYYL